MAAFIVSTCIACGPSGPAARSGRVRTFIIIEFRPAMLLRNDRPSPLDSATDRATDHLRYLGFVDGLRAVSILSVVGFHVGMPGFSGGFVGVDIFFVISGFLIINQIKAGLSSDRFSILSFYAHRSLRILPPYLIMLAATCAAAPFVLPTTDVAWDFLQSALLAPIMGSNILFFLSQGYFDISAIEKPLLHTRTHSVEAQFCLLAPVLLMLVFRLSNRRFGTRAAVIALVIGVASLAGAVVETSTSGRNAAFYLSHLRAWEFIAGGLIGAQLVAAANRLPRFLLELAGWIGLALIVIAVTTFDARMPYPSWNAVVPVAGAVLVILCGLARPGSTLRQFLSLRPLVAIGLVSYGWYLWHWPILSFLRIARMQEASLLVDGLGAGVLAFALACASYRYVEQPIRRWRQTPGKLENPLRIVARFVAACLAMALIGGASTLGGFYHTRSVMASRYGIEGKGVLDNGCERLGASGFPEHCFSGKVGLILGDSHATVLVGTFARRFQQLGLQLVSVARGGCYPLLLSPSQRRRDRRDDCARLIAPYERLLARPHPVTFAVVSGFWIYNDQAPKLLADLVAEFDPRTRVLLIGPVPTFRKQGLECVVLSDRYDGRRERCTRSRAEIEAANVAIVRVLQTLPAKFKNVRYVDPMGVFCDRTTCRPFDNDAVLYSDEHHLLPSGADRLFDSFAGDFLWLAKGDDRLAGTHEASQPILDVIDRAIVRSP